MNKFIYDPGRTERVDGWLFRLRAFGAIVVLLVRLLLGRGPGRLKP